MTTDIKVRLRDKAARMEAIDFVICAKLYREAADYIEQLEGQLSAQTAVKTEQPSHIQIAMAVRDACLAVSANFKSGGMSAVEALFKSRGEMSALDLRGIVSSIAPAGIEQPSLSDEKMANDVMLAAGFEVDYDKRRGVHTYTGFIEDAMKLLSAQRQDNKDALVWESTAACFTRFVSDARYQKFSPGVRAWYRPVCEKCGGVDSNKDAERYRKAIAYEDNAGLLYCAVMNHCPDKAAIDAEFDAEAIDIAIANGAPK